MQIAAPEKLIHYFIPPAPPRAVPLCIVPGIILLEPFAMLDDQLIQNTLSRIPGNVRLCFRHTALVSFVPPYAPLSHKRDQQKIPCQTASPSKSLEKPHPPLCTVRIRTSMRTPGRLCKQWRVCGNRLWLRLFAKSPGTWSTRVVMRRNWAP